MTSINRELIYVVETNDLKTVNKILTAPGFDVNMEIGSHKETLLHIAIRAQKPNIVKRLLEVPGINVNTEATNGTTPLISAVLNNDITCVKLLLTNPDIDVHLTPSQKNQGEGSAFQLSMPRLENEGKEKKEKEIHELLVEFDKQKEPSRPWGKKIWYNKSEHQGKKSTGESSTAGGAIYTMYKGKKYKIRIGQKGGRYILVGADKKKIYL